jgi:hypothetical protein
MVCWGLQDFELVEMATGDGVGGGFAGSCVVSLVIGVGASTTAGTTSVLGS